MSFFSELKRRHVVKVAVTYAIVAWLLIEIAATLLPAFAAPDWVLRVVVLLLAIGFVIALVLSWIYDLTPTGTERTDSAEATGHPITANQKLNALVIGALVLAVLFLGVDRYLDEPTPEGGTVLDQELESMAIDAIAVLSRDRQSMQSRFYLATVNRSPCCHLRTKARPKRTLSSWLTVFTTTS